MRSGRQRGLASSVRTHRRTILAFSVPCYFAGVKSYPRGVTTNSDGGIESYEVYYPVFEVMEQEDLVLNLHGEIPSDADTVRDQTSVLQLRFLTSA